MLIRVQLSLLTVLWIIVGSVVSAHAYEPPRAGLMLDAVTGETLYEDKASELRHPASLTKMMTLYLVFEALAEGKITLSTPVVASRHSADRAPSRLGHAKDEVISVDLAIDALVVRSANDVSAALGELLGETERRFADLMTIKARRLGMKDTVYRNASGLPDKEQVTTARDQAILGLALKNDFPQYYPRFSAREVSYKERTWNTNRKLVGKYDYITGIKTGFINASGFNVVTFAEKPEGDRIVVIMGGRSAKERNQIALDLLDGITPFHQLSEEQQAVRTAEIAKRKAKEVKPAEPKTEIASAEPSVQAEEIAVEPPASISPYAIQVGALPTNERAIERLSMTRPAFEMPNLRQYTLPLETSNGTVYRARIIGFESMAAAFDACDVVERKNIECMALIQK